MYDESMISREFRYFFRIFALRSVLDVEFNPASSGHSFQEIVQKKTLRFGSKYCVSDLVLLLSLVIFALRHVMASQLIMLNARLNSVSNTRILQRQYRQGETTDFKISKDFSRLHETSATETSNFRKTSKDFKKTTKLHEI